MPRPEDIAISFDDTPEYVPSNPRIAVLAWWGQLDPPERVLYRGLAGIGLGLAAIYWPLALIVPGIVLTALAVFNVALHYWRVTGG